MSCRIYWGSHGCDEAEGHVGIHRCGIADPCSEFEATEDVVVEDFADVAGRVRYTYLGGTWSGWHDSQAFYLAPIRELML